MERERPFLSPSVNRDLDSKSCWRCPWGYGGAGGWWGEAREESDSVVATQTSGTSSLCILQSSGKMPAPLQLTPHSSTVTCISELLGRILSTCVHGLRLFIYLTYTYWALQRRQWHPTLVLLPGKIPWTEEPGRLQSMRSLRVGHNWATSLSLLSTYHGPDTILDTVAEERTKEIKFSAPKS